MKIFCISLADVPSDTANSIQVMKVCQALTQQDHQVTLLVPENERSSIRWEDIAAHYGLSEQFEIFWLKTFSGRLGRRLFPWFAVWQALSLGAELFYVWPVQAAAAVLLLNRDVILEMHDLPTGQIGPLWFQLFLRLQGRKRLLFITQALRRAFEERFTPPLPDEQVVIGPNGVDLERFEGLPDPSSARRQLSLPDRLTIACTGHLYAGRGTALFVSLAKLIPEANFIWVGGRSEDVQVWQTDASSWDLKNITFTGFIPNQELPLYQAAADILLLPYQKEITGSSGKNTAEIYSSMKMFEYMAVGRAIVASDTLVIREVLNEQNAVFCPAEEIEAWILALKDLLGDQDQRQRLGRQAVQDVQQYTWEKRVKNTLQNF